MKKELTWPAAMLAAIIIASIAAAIVALAGAPGWGIWATWLIIYLTRPRGR